MQPKRRETLGASQEDWSGTLPSGTATTVRCWKQLHFKQARDIEVSVVQVEREAATGSKRDPRERWFVLLDEAPLPLPTIAPVYAHRFSHEHGYRYLKQDLFWCHVHVRTPEQFERWSLVVAIVMNQLCLIRLLGQASYRLWERRRLVVTPRQVRRIMPRILSQVGTPARRCQRRGKSPGRAIGFSPKRAERYPVVIKGPKKSKKSLKSSA